MPTSAQSTSVVAPPAPVGLPRVPPPSARALPRSSVPPASDGLSFSEKVLPPHPTRNDANARNTPLHAMHISKILQSSHHPQLGKHPNPKGRACGRRSAYRRHRPETSALYEVERDNLETLFARRPHGEEGLLLPTRPARLKACGAG